MKNLSLLIISILALSIFSCQREDVQKNGELVTITATQPGLPDLKTNIGGAASLAVTWNATDMLAVYDATGGNVNKLFTYTAGAGTQSATFTGTIDNWDSGDKTFNAVYPYDASRSFQEYGAYQFDIPSTQTQDFTSEVTKYAHLGQYDFMAASPVIVTQTGSGQPAINFSFKHLMAILDIEVTNSTGANITVTKISLQRLMAEFTTYAMLDLSKSPGESGFYLSMIQGEQLDLVVSSIATPTASGSVFTGSMIIAPVDLSGGYTNFVVTVGGSQYTVTKTIGPNVEAGKRYKAKITISSPDLTDSRDSKVYKTVKIGTQTWMAENLNFLPGSGSSGCYGDNSLNCDTYGRLYDWTTATADTHGNGTDICPTGWHLPTDGEFTTLTTFLGGESVAGGPLKETGTTHWASQSAGATNSSGFTALPGGLSFTGVFFTIGTNAYFWSSSESDASSAWSKNLSSTTDGVDRMSSGRDFGFSVRCLQNK